MDGAIVNPVWWQTGIIIFPYQNSNSTLQDALGTVRELKKPDELEYAKEKPFGLLRVADIASREVPIELEGVDDLP